MGLFSKLSEGLKKTRNSIAQGIDGLMGSFSVIDEDMLLELEEILIMADVGALTASKVCERLRGRVKKSGAANSGELRSLMRETVTEMMDGDCGLNIGSKPSVILVIGVNGAGKRVLLCAGDTFRAAAIQQLEVWADRAGVEIIRGEEGGDPAAVVFDSLRAGAARGADVIICDTAGRLHNKKNLMDELSKISRVVARELPDAQSETLLVLDATTGQNALNQARQFGQAAGVTGIVLTKLDGTAKGGVVIGIREELGIPVKYIGVGEGLDDLRPFDAAEFASALFPEEEG